MQVQTLPKAHATPALTDFFSWGYDPYTHACKTRPLTTVGWTSLSVIVIVVSTNSFMRADSGADSKVSASGSPRTDDRRNGLESFLVSATSCRRARSKVLRWSRLLHQETVAERTAEQIVEKFASHSGIHCGCRAGHFTSACAATHKGAHDRRSHATGRRDSVSSQELVSALKIRRCPHEAPSWPQNFVYPFCFKN